MCVYVSVRVVHLQHWLPPLLSSAVRFESLPLVQKAFSRPFRVEPGRNGSGVALRTLDYDNPVSNPVLRC